MLGYLYRLGKNVVGGAPTFLVGTPPVSIGTTAAFRAALSPPVWLSRMVKILSRTRKHRYSSTRRQLRILDLSRLHEGCFWPFPCAFLRFHGALVPASQRAQPVGRGGAYSNGCSRSPASALSGGDEAQGEGKRKAWRGPSVRSRIWRRRLPLSELALVHHPA
jgi:hypothetical protein